MPTISIARRVRRNIQKALLVLPVCIFFLSVPVFSSDEDAYQYNEKGLIKIKSGDYQGAIDDFRTANMRAPSNPIVKKNLASAYNNYGFVLYQNGDLRGAIEKMETGLYYDPDSVQTLYNLAQAHYRAQNISKAKEYLERVVKLDPNMAGAQSMLGKLNNEVGVEKNFEMTETMHFIIASARDVPVESFSYIRTYLEEAYGRVGGFLDHYPKDKVVVIIYSETNYDQMLKGRPAWTLALFDGKVRIPANKFKYSNEEVIKIIYHEYSHAVVYDITGKNCPTWLREGIAGRVEDLVTPKDKGMIKKYVEHFGLLPIGKIPENFTQAENIQAAMALYIEAYLLVDFIVRREGASGLKSILAYLSKGNSISYAIGSVFREGMPDFEKKWLQYVREDYRVENIPNA